jgi:hypothetical protein
VGLTHLERLEAESIDIMREAVAEQRDRKGQASTRRPDEVTWSPSRASIRRTSDLITQTLSWTSPGSISPKRRA